MRNEIEKKQGKKKVPLTECRKNKDIIVDLHKQGKTVEEIKDIVGYKVSSVRQVIYSAGLKPFSVSDAEYLERCDKVVGLFQNGMSKTKIRTTLGIASKTINDILIAEGLYTRVVRGTYVETTPEIVKVKKELKVVEVPKVSEKMVVIENGRYVEKVKVFRDITELAGRQKVFMERRLI